MKHHVRGRRGAFLPAAVVFLLLAVFGLTAHLTVFRGAPSQELWWPDQPLDSQAVATLVKPDGEDYRILLFSDIQLGLNPFANRRALRMMDALVAETNPHFIMTTGDNGSFIYSSPLVHTLIRRFASYQRPWGCVLGNHDSEGIADRNWLGQQYEQAEHSLFRRGPSNIHGVGNYAISIVNDAGSRLCSLIMLDSNGRREYPQGKDYDILYPDQIDWYTSVVQTVDKDETDAPSLLFFHIPLPEVALAADLVSNKAFSADAVDVGNPTDSDISADGDISADSDISADGDISADDAVFGVVRERVCCAPVNSGLFERMVELGSTTHVFNGHDHVNNLSTLYEGIRFTYGLKTGPSAYHDADLQGGTLITLHEDNATDAPIRISITHVGME